MCKSRTETRTEVASPDERPRDDVQLAHPELTFMSRAGLQHEIHPGSPLADPDLAARKLVKIANGVEAVQDGRIYIERVNAPFLAAGSSGEDFRARILRAIANGWLWRHESGTYVKFTDSGAALFV
jgi:hypothetical protein